MSKCASGAQNTPCGCSITARGFDFRGRPKIAPAEPSWYNVPMDFIVWRAPEFERHEKSTGWFAGLTVVLTAVFIFAIWSESYLFALLVPLMGFLLVHYAKKEPPERTFTIDGLG
ncbi:MAG: hypothetical protein Q8R38_04635, partial [Candidatus Omnitrophota bacterium]|nr:hypothetical protein [Candidatus Omnitrophota bacterium]